MWLHYPLIRYILHRERIDIIHGHQSTSAIACATIVSGNGLGYKTVFTDHSLFRFAEPAGIHLGKAMMLMATLVDECIAVSFTSRENLALRTFLDPRKISVIPNAVDYKKFTPKAGGAPPLSERLNIIILSRLTSRKGMDLVVDVIPVICSRFALVHFIIGGDGPKRLDLEEMREYHQLHDRMELLGAINHKDVRDLLVRGHMFLNCSLTEAFCIALLEAVSCGLYTVSTRVGGVSEVLPSDMITLTEPYVLDIIEAITEAIPKVQHVKPLELHRRIQGMYHWSDVTDRTEQVYERVLTAPNLSLIARLRKLWDLGQYVGKLYCFVVLVDYIIMKFFDWLVPEEEIERAVDFPTTDVLDTLPAAVLETEDID